MWNISKEGKERFLNATYSPFMNPTTHWERAFRKANEEENDLITRLKEELEEVKGELIQVLPSQFIPYFQNGTLNQPHRLKQYEKFILSGKKTPSDLWLRAKPNNSGGDELPSVDRLKLFSFNFF